MSVDQQEKASFLKRPVGGKAAKDTAPKTGKFNIPPRPQVNLMPPEILEDRRVAALKGKLVMAIIALLVVCAVAFGAAYLMKLDAQARYHDAQQTADDLTAKKKEYAPVVQVQKDITFTTKARTFVLSTEVDWTSYAYAIQSVLPEGVTIESMSITGISPGDDLAKGADDLTQAGIAVISFSAISDTLPDASEWIEALQSVSGLATANVQSAVLQDKDDEATYQVSATVQVTEDALANRTFDDEAAGDDAGGAAGDATDDSGDGN